MGFPHTFSTDVGDVLCQALILSPAPLTTTGWLPVGPTGHPEVVTGDWPSCRHSPRRGWRFALSCGTRATSMAFRAMDTTRPSGGQRMTPLDERPSVRLRRLVTGSQVSQASHISARPGIADL